MTLTENTCGHCGTRVLGGWSGNGRTLGLLVTVDADPLTAEQELAAAVAGCRTWTLHTVAAELHLRSARTIRERPAGTRPRQTVHATHQCTPGQWRSSR